MISVITAVHNQLPMNRMFWEYLCKYTDLPFELIVIDNCSTDGSREFFQSLPKEIVTVICNEHNYSYPHCQNQGISVARYDTFAFLNNDLLVSPHWDSRILRILGCDNRHVLSLSSNDRLKDARTTRRLRHTWKRIKYPVRALFGQGRFGLNLMSKLCYGNWEKYTQRIFHRYGYSLTEGFSGAGIVMDRRALEILGPWDPSQQAADFDLFFRTCDRAARVGDIRPLAVVNGIYTHHYSRLTSRVSYPPFADRAALRLLEDKWSEEQRERWMRIVAFKDHAPALAGEHPDHSIWARQRAAHILSYRQRDGLRLTE